MTRQARRERMTNETRVSVNVELDGTGLAAVETGVGMLDHLLGSFAHHSLVDIEISTEGDLIVDDHHTVEDTLLVLGMAISDALGDRTGIQRFGDASVPMDEALARCAVDYGGRPYAVVDLTFRADRMGDLSTQMVEHALEAFARTVGATVHISAKGRNDHHIAEAAFKALARATRSAIARDERRLGVASTKGTT